MRAPLIHFIDGYHGGIRGASPTGALGDIMEALAGDPGWAVTLDLEPATWDLLARREPRAYREAIRALQDPCGRLAIGNAFFAQPYLQFFNGESGLRQLRLGLDILRRHMPGADFSVYSPQEPCWATYLPRLLEAFGITLVSLKDPGTAFSGWMRGVDAHLVRWVGPDGATVEAVPRYGCEGFIRAWETEARYATAAFAESCRANGITHPVGTGLQDFGWPARRAVPFKQPPGSDMSYLAFTTWREWRQRSAPPSRNHRFTVDDIIPILPFGDWILHRLAGAVRAAEHALLSAERLSAASWLISGTPWPAEVLERAWTDLAWSQHHDAWICPDSALRFCPGEPPWGEAARHEARSAQHAAETLIAGAVHALSVPGSDDMVTLVNQAGVARDDLAECELDLGDAVAVRATLVIDGVDHRDLPAQIVANPDYGLFDAWHHRHARTVLVRCPIPPLGQVGVRIEAAPTGTAQGGASATRLVDGTVELHGGGIRLVLDPARGGTCTEVEVASIGALSRSPQTPWFELRGYDPVAGTWCSSTDHPSEIAILEEGPLRAAVEVRGAIGHCRFRLRVSVDDRGEGIDVHLMLTATEAQSFGDPEGTPHGNTRDDGIGDLAIERHAAWHDDHYKLQLLLPMPVGFHDVDKASAFDVCRSPAVPTRFNSWEQAQHRAILHWLDLRNEAGDCGVAVLTDRVVAYESDGSGGFGVVVGWGRDRRALLGQADLRLRLIPHPGNWQSARIWQRHECFSAGIVAAIGRLPRPAVQWLSAPDLIPTTVEVDDGALLLRAWNPGSAGDFAIRAQGSVRWQGESLAGAPDGSGGNGPDLHVTLANNEWRQWRLWFGDRADAMSHRFTLDSEQPLGNPDVVIGP